MLLYRRGSKCRIAHLIEPYFPEHRYYIEMFFGAGGMFFNRKTESKYNIVNDLNSDIFNLFWVVKTQPEELARAWELMPIHEDLWKHWKQSPPTDPIDKACSFLMFSKFSYLGRGDTLQVNRRNIKQLTLGEIRSSFAQLQNCEFLNSDFRNIFKKIHFREDVDRTHTLIYADPPYVGTDNNYGLKFTKSDSIDLFNVLVDSRCKFAMSEFDNPFIIDQAKQRGLNVFVIGERQNLKNRRTEILITNYEPPCVQKESSEVGLFAEAK